MEKKQKRVPEVLWRLFRDRARTLADTIISLIPTPGLQPCGCKASACLRCSAAAGNAMSFILRPNDPADYHKLLNRCFVVVDDSAPPLSMLSRNSGWSQHQIVVRTIETMMGEQPASSNAICSGYNKINYSSPIIELLTSSAWTLLLKRVGDDIMTYLLNNTSVFLPLPQKKHHQVTGPPISNLIVKLAKHTAESPHQHPPVIQLGLRKKRNRFDDANSMSEMQQLKFLCVDGPISSLSHVGCPSKSYISSSGVHSANKRGQMSPHKTVMPTTGAGAVKYEAHPDELKDLTNITLKPKRGSRPFKWQRQRKRRCLDVEETSDKTCNMMDCTHEGSSVEGLLIEDSCANHGSEKVAEQFSSCFILRAANLVTGGAEINRVPIFYNLQHSSSVLPQGHILNSLKPNFAGSKSLVESVFGLSAGKVNDLSIPCSHNSSLCLIGSACLYHLLVKLFKIIIWRTQCCKHFRLLDKHCIASSLNRSTLNKSSLKSEGNGFRELSEKSHCNNTELCKETLEAFDPQIEAIKSNCSKSQVVSFIWAVCRNIIPPDLLGTPSNWRVLRRNISKFIQLRRFEKFSLKQCMHKLKISGFPFLQGHKFWCVSDEQELKGAEMRRRFSRVKDAACNLKLKILEKWMFWFFSYLIVPLVQANFYVTETEHGKQDVYYYQKSVWRKLRNTATACLRHQSYQLLDAADVKKIISNRLFGFSKLRLRPKENGVRMLANLQVSSKLAAQEPSSQVHCIPTQRKVGFCSKSIKFKHFKSVNSVLRNTHAVLKAVQWKEPEKLGSSVFDYNDMYRKLCPFLIGLKNGSAAIPNVFVVICDVRKAFDSIDQDKLLTVMKDVVAEDKYFLKQSCHVVCSKKSLWVHENLVLTDTNISTGLSRFRSSNLFGSLHTVLVNQDCIRPLKKEELLFNLNEHVKRNVLQFDKKFYLQGLGIPQGSILSSLLCSFYYGHLERNVIFPFLEKVQKPGIEESSKHNPQDSPSAENCSEDTFISSPCSLLLRLIDDFLFISTSKKQAASFFSRLHRGFRDYNCYMNEDKFCLNFDGGLQGIPSNRVYVGEDGILFLRWSGLLLNSCTLEVQADYTRYLNTHLSSSLTVCWQDKPSHRLRVKLCNFLRPKCHPIFFDSNINSAAVVRLNIYQAFLLCAMKFHCYVFDMSYICKLHTRSYAEIIARSLRFMYVLIKKRMRAAHLGPKSHPVLHLEEEEVEWLGLNAYIQVLKRKQSRHKDLLSILWSKLSAHSIGLNASSQLKYTIDRTHSSLLWKIKY